MAAYIADEQILNAALDVIAEKGYAGATTRQIAAAADVSEVTLFRRFGSKKKLLIEAVKQEAEKYNAGDIAYSGDLRADLLSIVAFYHTLVQSRGQLMAMMLMEVPRQPELREVAQLPLAILGTITAVIERYQREGALAAEPPLDTLAALVGPLYFDQVVGLIHPDREGSSFSSKVYVERFLHGRTPGRHN